MEDMVEDMEEVMEEGMEEDTGVDLSEQLDLYIFIVLDILAFVINWFWTCSLLQGNTFLPSNNWIYSRFKPIPIRGIKNAKKSGIIEFQSLSHFFWL